MTSVEHDHGTVTLPHGGEGLDHRRNEAIHEKGWTNISNGKLRVRSKQWPHEASRAALSLDVMSGPDRIDAQLMGGPDRIDAWLMSGPDQMGSASMGGPNRTDSKLMGGPDSMDFDVMGPSINSFRLQNIAHGSSSATWAILKGET